MTRVEAHVHIGKARRGNRICVSVRTLPTGRVYYVGTQRLLNATFSVQPAGLANFRETSQKNVHAFVRGTDVGGTRVEANVDPYSDWRVAKYNPNVNDTFVDEEFGHPVFRAERAVIIGKTLYYQ